MMSTYVAVFALVLAYVALVAAYFALRTLAKVRRATALLGRGGRGGRGGSAQESLLEAIDRQADATATVVEELAELRAFAASTRDEALAAAQSGSAVVAGVLRNVALVRYDAFDGVSGRMSFSLALLDEQGDGVAISAIAGQSDTRVYAKGIAAGHTVTGEHDLSPEEQQAVASALQKQRSGLLSRKAG
jgi:hypothetical protein